MVMTFLAVAGEPTESSSTMPFPFESVPALPAPHCQPVCGSTVIKEIDDRSAGRFRIFRRHEDAAVTDSLSRAAYV